MGMRYRLLSVFFTEIVLGTLILFMLFPQQGLIFQIIRICCASLLLFYLPGYRIGYIFFAEHDLSAFERFILNFLVSVTIIILLSYYLYFSGNAVSTIRIYLVLGLVLLIAMAFALIRWRGWTGDAE